MKKISTILLAVLLTTNISALAFSDISDPALSKTAQGLSSLKIMEGVGGNNFSPDTALTRAQFSKIAVLSLGTDDVSAYKNYTIFPDVPYTHWAASYINAAVREHSIIRGFSDGTFAPDAPITYGQACTMFLSMLGYTVEDVGPFWPQDYITKADALGLNDGIPNLSAESTLTRGNAAIMLSNTLSTATKEGGVLLSASYSKIISDSILIATDKTDSELSANQAKFYENGEEIIRATVGDLSTSLIGSRGSVIYDNTKTTEVLGFLPDTTSSITTKIQKSEVDMITTDDGSIKVPIKTPVIINGSVRQYSDAWYDLVAGSTVNIYYNESGTIDIIALGQSFVTAQSFVKLDSTSSSIGTGYNILKNGAQITAADIREYDAVSVDTSSMTAYVSDRKITGYYTEASPSFSYPSQVTILDKTFNIAEDVSPFFKNIKFGDKITLIIDNFGNVVAAFNASEVTADMQGILTEFDGTTAKVSLFDGVEISAEVDLSATGYQLSTSKAYILMQKPITISERKDGTIKLSELDSDDISSDWDIDTSTIGDKTVASNVRIYEQAAKNGPVIEISLNDLEDYSTIDKSDINGVFYDSSDVITHIILADVTGESYIYGIGSGVIRETIVEGGTTVIKDEHGNIIDTVTTNNESAFSITLRTPDGTNVYKLVSNIGGGSGPIGMPAGFENKDYNAYITPLKLISVGSVGLDDFDTSEGVNTSDGYYKLASDVVVYVEEQKAFLTLSQAKSNFTSFKLYANETLENGGKIRVIYAE